MLRPIEKLVNGLKVVRVAKALPKVIAIELHEDSRNKPTFGIVKRRHVRAAPVRVPGPSQRFGPIKASIAASFEDLGIVSQQIVHLRPGTRDSARVACIYRSVHWHLTMSAPTAQDHTIRRTERHDVAGPIKR